MEAHRDREGGGWARSLRGGLSAAWAERLGAALSRSRSSPGASGPAPWSRSRRRSGRSRARRRRAAAGNGAGGRGRLAGACSRCALAGGQASARGHGGHGAVSARCSALGAELRRLRRAAATGSAARCSDALRRSAPEAAPTRPGCTVLQRSCSSAGRGAAGALRAVARRRRWDATPDQRCKTGCSDAVPSCTQLFRSK